MTRNGTVYIVSIDDDGNSLDNFGAYRACKTLRKAKNILSAGGFNCIVKFRETPSDAFIRDWYPRKGPVLMSGIGHKGRMRVQRKEARGEK